MKRSDFIKNSLMTLPMMSFNQTAFATDRPTKGIKVADGDNRMHEKVKLDGVVPIDFKVLSQDTVVESKIR